MSAVLIEHFRNGSSTPEWIREMVVIETEQLWPLGLGPLESDLAPEVEVPRLEPKEFDSWYDRDRYIAEAADEHCADCAELRDVER